MDQRSVVQDNATTWLCRFNCFNKLFSRAGFNAKAFRVDCGCCWWILALHFVKTGAERFEDGFDRAAVETSHQEADEDLDSFGMIGEMVEAPKIISSIDAVKRKSLFFEEVGSR